MKSKEQIKADIKKYDDLAEKSWREYKFQCQPQQMEVKLNIIMNICDIMPKQML